MVTMGFDHSPGSSAAHHKIRLADPLGLSQLVVDLRSQHLAYWRQCSAYHPRDPIGYRSKEGLQSKQLTAGVFVKIKESIQG
eukprot:1152660-Pelagomonas_calceolata.AAC.2